MNGFRIGSVTAWPSRNTLEIDGTEQHVEPKVMALLVVLAEHAGDVVARQALLDRVWAGTVVGEEALTRCVSELRAALGDRAARPEYIQTVPKRGYRLLQAPEPLAPAPKDGAGRWRWPLAAAVLAAVAVALVLLLGPAAAPPPRSIAVLPLQSASNARDGDHGNYFGEGLSAGIFDALLSVPELRVSSRTRSFAQDPSADARAVGERLGVETVLRGSLVRAEDELRVAVQLVEVASGEALWSERFQGSPEELFAIQDEVVAAVARTLDIPLLAPKRVARPTQNIAAYDFYLLGRHYWQMRTPDSLARAVEYFKEAIAVDPEVAEAHSGLADAYLLQYAYGDRTHEEALALAGDAIDQALALDPELADAHASRGIWHQHQRHFEDAEQALQRATELDPNHTMAHMWLGNAVLSQGRIADAHQHYERACALDPQHPVVVQNYFHAQRQIGDYAGARQTLRDYGDGAPPAVLQQAAGMAIERGDWTRAQALIAGLDGSPTAAALLRWQLAWTRGDRAAALDVLETARQLAPGDVELYLAELEHHARRGALDAFEAARQDAGEARFDRAAMADGDKLARLERVWQGLLHARADQPAEAVPLLIEFIEDDASIMYLPAFQLMVYGHLLASCQRLGDREAFDHWRRRAERWLERVDGQGWASFEFRLQRAAYLAVAGDTEGALADLRNAANLGVLLRGELNRDPRLATLRDAGLLDEFV